MARMLLAALGVGALIFPMAQSAAADEAALPSHASAARIVSVGGSITEIVYALDAQERLVAVDSTSQFPRSVRGLPNVGYMRQLSAEPILALRPSLVLAEADSGPPSALDQIRAASVHVVAVPDIPSPRGVLDKIVLVARALGEEGKGMALANRIERDFSVLRDHLGAVTRRPSVLFLLSVGGTPLAAGRETSAAGIVDLAGGRNAIDAFEGFKPLSPEAAIAAAPEVLLVTERTLDMLGGRDGLLSRPEIRMTPAGRSRNVVAMDGLLLLGFGPRTPAAIRQLAAALHPGLSLPPAASD